MTKPCPNCGRPAGWENNPDRPFCSERCRMIDLGRWADEEYAVPDDETALDFPVHEGLPEDFQPS